MSANSNVTRFNQQLASVQTLAPREVGTGKSRNKIAQAIYTRQAVTIVGVKIAISRFLPVSHAGYSNETYVDKVDLLGKTRAEFIGRKMKGIERRAHMTLFREMVEANNGADSWRGFFEKAFGRACTIPGGLCIACWNCSLFGGLEAGKGATFSRIRYFDTYSVEDAAECIQSDDTPEQMAIGNTVGEDLSVERGETSFHRYEYVKAGTRFPFITIIESPTLLDVAGYLAAVKQADLHGYGKYSANHGKFSTEFLAISTGYPQFSVLDMLPWLESGDLSQPESKLKFEALTARPPSGDQPAPGGAGVKEPHAMTLFGEEITDVQRRLTEVFSNYFQRLNGKVPNPEDQD